MAEDRDTDTEEADDGESEEIADIPPTDAGPSGSSGETEPLQDDGETDEDPFIDTGFDNVSGPDSYIGSEGDDESDDEGDGEESPSVDLASDAGASPDTGTGTDPVEESGPEAGDSHGDVQPADESVDEEGATETTGGEPDEDLDTDTEQEESAESGTSDAEEPNEETPESDSAETADSADETDSDDTGVGPLGTRGKELSEKRKRIRQGKIDSEEVREELGIKRNQGKTAEATGQSGSPTGPQGRDDDTDTADETTETDFLAAAEYPETEELTTGELRDRLNLTASQRKDIGREIEDLTIYRDTPLGVDTAERYQLLRRYDPDEHNLSADTDDGAADAGSEPGDAPVPPEPEEAPEPPSPEPVAEADTVIEPETTTESQPPIPDETADPEVVAETDPETAQSVESVDGVEESGAVEPPEHEPEQESDTQEEDDGEEESSVEPVGGEGADDTTTDDHSAVNRQTVVQPGGGDDQPAEDDTETGEATASEDESTVADWTNESESTESDSDPFDELGFDDESASPESATPPEPPTPTNDDGIDDWGPVEDPESADAETEIGGQAETHGGPIEEASTSDEPLSVGESDTSEELNLSSGVETPDDESEFIEHDESGAFEEDEAGDERDYTEIGRVDVLSQEDVSGESAENIDRPRVDSERVDLGRVPGLFGTFSRVFGGIADGLFYSVVANREGVVSRYQWKLNQARLNITAERFIARALTLTLFATIFGGIIGAGVGLAAPLGAVGGPLPTGLNLPAVLGVGGGILLGGLSGVLVFRYPDRQVRVRSELISYHLPLTVAHLYALARTNVELPETIRRVASQSHVHGEAAREFQNIVTDMDIRGTALRDALAKASSETPNDELSDLLGEMVDVLNGKGTLAQLLEARLARLRDKAKIEQERILSEVTDVLIAYTIIGVLGVALATVFLSQFVGSFTVAAAIFYVGLPVFGAITLWRIGSKRTLPEFRLASPLPKPDTPEVGLFGGENGMGLRSRIPRIGETDGGVATHQLENNELVQQASKIRESDDSGIITVVKTLPFQNQLWALPISALFVSIYVGVMLALGIGNPAAALSTVTGTVTWVVLPALLAIVPPMTYYEVVRIHNEQVNSALPTVFRALAAAGQPEYDLTSRVERAVEDTNSYINDEIERLHNHLAVWSGDHEEALIMFANRVQNPRLSRAVMTLVDADTGGENTQRVLDVLATEVRVAEQLDSLRRSQTKPFTTLLAGLAVLFTISEYLLVTEIIGATTLAFSVGGVAVQAGALFFHGSLIQSVICGELIGQTSQDNLRAGLKYTALLLIVSTTIYVLGPALTNLSVPSI